MSLFLRNKVIILGDPAVGKTALTQMFKTDGAQYPKNYIMTVGAEFCVKPVVIPEKDTTVELYIFDLAGKDLYRSLITRYLEGATTFVIVYDVTNKESFNSCSKWLEFVRRHLTEKVTPGILIANKVDLEDRVLVKSHQGNEFAQNNGLDFFECSAYRGTDIDQPFQQIARNFQLMYEEKMKVYELLKRR